MATKSKHEKTLTLQLNGTKFTTFKEKEKVLREKLFPKAPKADEEREQRETKGRLEVTREETWSDFQGAGPFKAPGKDEIVVQAITETLNLTEERIRETYQTSINNGNHLREWRRTIGAIIPKPKKQDYTSVNSYRLVSLLNTLGKGLEKIVGETLTREVENTKEKGFHRT